MLNTAPQAPNLSAADRAAVKERAQRRGLSAVLLGLLGGLVAVAMERMRRQQDRAEQRAARKEKQIEAEMQALSAPPLRLTGRKKPGPPFARRGGECQFAAAGAAQAA